MTDKLQSDTSVQTLPGAGTTPDESIVVDSTELVWHYLAPIAKYFYEPGVTEIMVNAFDQIYIEQHGIIEPVNERFESEDKVRTLIEMIATYSGQSVDQTNHPIVDAKLPDGSRACGVLKPWSAGGSSLSIRLFPKTVLTADDLLKSGSFTDEMYQYLKLAVRVRSNILVSGSTGSGKTTLLNVLSRFIPEQERVVTVEDTEELKLDVPNCVQLVTANRKKDSDDAQDTSMPAFIKTALRQNPDRIIVGEIRDMNAASAFLQAINTGHNGCASTLHANSCVDGLLRLQNFLGATGLPVDYVESQVRSNLHLLIHAEKVPNVGRVIVSITEVRGNKTFEMWSFNFLTGEHTKTQDDFTQSYVLQLAERYGFSL